MCSCAFYPLHLVYSGLIWTFGVRVNYISKLFLHFLHSHIGFSSRVRSWFSKIRHSELNLKRKFMFTIFDIIKSWNVIFVNLQPNWRSSNTDTPHDIICSNMFILVMCTDIQWLSTVICVCVSQRKKCPGITFADINLRGRIEFSKIYGHFFFHLFYYTYILANYNTEQTYSFWKDFIFQLSVSKSILNYAPNTIASYSFIFICRCYFDNRASWCAWFFFSASL